MTEYIKIKTFIATLNKGDYSELINIIDKNIEPINDEIYIENNEKDFDMEITNITGKRFETKSEAEKFLEDEFLSLFKVIKCFPNDIYYSNKRLYYEDYTRNYIIIEDEEFFIYNIFDLLVKNPKFHYMENDIPIIPRI